MNTTSQNSLGLDANDFFGNDILPWHQENWNMFAAYIKQQRMPHALLIHGRQGLGKMYLARQFAKSLLCVDSNEHGLFCGKCHRCQLFEANTHPDIFNISPDEAGKNIVIGQIREIINHLMLTPQYDAYRVVIINNAQQMNHAAANGFLKCLEEPTQRTVFILVTEVPSAIPATIYSRCQNMLLTVPENKISLAWLRQLQIDDDLPALLDLANGAPLLAIQYAAQGLLALKKKCFLTWFELTKQQLTPVAVANEWQHLPYTHILTWMCSWVMEIIKYTHHIGSDKLSNQDFEIALQEMAQKLDLKCLFEFYDCLLIAKSRLDTQLNKQLLLEEILINWSLLTQKH